MTEQQRQESLERLRKLYKFAISKNNVKWAERIKLDAERIKSIVTEEKDLYDRALEIFGGDIQDTIDKG